MLIRCFRPVRDNKTVFEIKNISNSKDLDTVYKFIYNFEGEKRIDVASLRHQVLYVIVYDKIQSIDKIDIIDIIDNEYVLEFNKENFNLIKRKMNV